MSFIVDFLENNLGTRSTRPNEKPPTRDDNYDLFWGAYVKSFILTYDLSTFAAVQYLTLHALKWPRMTSVHFSQITNTWKIQFFERKLRNKITFRNFLIILAKFIFKYYILLCGVIFQFRVQMSKIHSQKTFLKSIKC